MGGWVLVAAASGVWIGVLLGGLGDPLPSAHHAISLLASGVVVLVLAVAARQVVGPGDEQAARRFALLVMPVVLGFALMGAGWYELHDSRIRASPIGLLAGHAVVVWATLDSDPEAGTFGWSVSARTDVVFPDGPQSGHAVRTSSRVWVRGSGPVPTPTTGDRVEVRGLVQAPDGPFASFLHRRGYAASLTATRIQFRGPPSNPVLQVANAIRSSLRDSLSRVLPAREAGLVMGLALGDTSRLDLDMEDAFRATGLSHLVAVSGANVAMFLAPILGLVTLVGLGVRGRAVVGVAAVAFFVLLTRAEPSVMRAGAMTGLTMLGVFLGRPRSPPAIVGCSVLGLLVMDPSLAYSIGFQLSVVAIVGMVLLAAPVANRLAALPKGLALAAGATLGAQAGVTPLLLFHFGVVPTVTLPANLLAFPAVSPAMLFGLAAGLGGLVWRPLGLLVGGLARLPLGYLEGAADRLARSPLPSITSPGGQIWALVLGLAAVVAAAWWLRSGKRVP